MENSLAKLIDQFAYDDAHFSFGKYGMIFSSIFDRILCLPNKLGPSSVIRGHDDSIRLTFKIMYKDFLPLFHKNVDMISKAAPDYACFVDKAEMIYSIFLASIGEVSFLDSSEGDFTSGLFFLPENLSSLSSNQIRALYLFLKEIRLKEKNMLSSPIYEAMLVPDFQNPLRDCTYLEFDEIQRKIDALYMGLSKKSIS